MYAIERTFPSLSLNHAVLPAPNSATPSTVFSPGRSYSSKTTPRERSSASSASKSETVKPICVWSPDGAPNEVKSRKRVPSAPS